VPDGFRDWVRENAGRLAVANNRGTLPIFLQENRRWWKDLTEIDTINRQAIHKTVSHAAAFGAESESLARELGVRVTPVNVKSESRTIEKAISDYHGDVFEVNDIIRNTFIAMPGEVDRVVKAVPKWAKKVIEHKVQASGMGYSGHLFKVWFRNGVRAEVQVNTPQMIYAKEMGAREILGEELHRKIREASGLPHGLGHRYYEEWRVLDELERRTAEQAGRMRELEALSQAYYGRIRDVEL